MRVLARLLAAVLFLTLAIDASAAEAATKPSAPRSVRATPANHAVKVTWAAPSSNGGARIDRYAVQQRNGPTARWVTVKFTSAAARSWTRTGLVNGSRYYFRVRAHNRLGYGTASASVSATPRTVPSSPRKPAMDTGDLSFSAGWTASISNGGARIDYYVIDISTDAATWTTPTVWRTDGSSPVPTFTNLLPGTQYWFRFRAHNEAGFSVGTGAGPYRAYTSPHPVTALAAEASSGQVALTWTTPTSNIELGIPPATLYKIERTSDGGSTWAEVGTTPNTSFTATGLADGTTYDFRVSARSSITKIGYGPTTATGPVTPIGVPTVPQSVGLGWRMPEASNVLTWEAPASDGGSDITGYVVEYETASTTPPLPTFTFGPDARSGLAQEFALDHTFRIKACNDLGCGPWSADIGPIPGGVQNATIEDARGEAAAIVTLDWDPPANDGIAPVADYTVSRSADGGLTWDVLGTTADASTTGWVDETAAYETTYKYRVVANGADGSGAWTFFDITTGPVRELSVSTTAIQLTEGSSDGFLVLLDPVAADDTVIQVETSNAMAAVPTSATVTVPAGQTSAMVTIEALDDPNAVSEEVTITVRLGTQERTVTITLVDDDL